MTKTTPLVSTEEDHYLELFSALSEPLRVRIVALIAGRDELGCTALEKALPVSKSTISYHVKILSRAGMVDVRKEGRYYFYRLRRDVFDYYLPHFLERLPSAD